MRPLAKSSMKATVTEATATAKATFTPPSTVVQRSPWHSPVPYLFGGLAAMLGLIAFALLILACSYWRFSGAAGEEDEAAEEKGENGSEEKVAPVFEERYLVIMAGEVNPTFLATPSTNKNSSSCKNGDSNYENDEASCNERVIEVRVMDADQENHDGGEPPAAAGQERSHR